MTLRFHGPGAAACFLLLNVAAFPALAATSGNAKGAATAGSLAQLTTPLAWPVAAVLIALLFRRPLASMVSAIGGRITKLSLFKVEVELLPTEVATAPLLNELKSAAVTTPVNDSTAMMLQQVQEGGPAQFAVIDLGQGREWLTSRLYIAAIMLERMRGVRAFLFLEESPPTKRRFVAIAPAARVRWALAQNYPWLEGAWLNASNQVAPRLAAVQPPLSPIIKSETGAFDTDTARDVVRNFIGALQQHNPAPSPEGDAQWTVLSQSRLERATWIDRGGLEALLPSECFEAWAPAMRDAPRGRRTRAILRRSGEFIALVEDDMRFAGLIVDRRALLEQLAATSSEEPES